MMKYIVFVMLVFTGGAAYAQLDKASLDAFLHRIVKDKAPQFQVEYIAQEGGKDVFELEGRGAKVILRGSNGLSVASALNYYLKNYCHHLITWNGAALPLPGVLPAVKKKVHRSTPYTYRYYLNYCTFQYTMAWWDWDRWQREIDWMALNGINMPLSLTGEEAIWQEVYKSMGFRDEELDKFYTGPAFFSWLWMGNIDAWGGPLPAHWKTSHAELQKKILAAERAFGMKPVLPAFTGHVPPSFKDRFPKAHVKKTNWDAGFDDVYILDPSDDMFVTIGRKFIEAQTKVFGTDHFYSADTFNENVPPTSDSSYLDGMSKKVFASMAAADPRAVWVMQGWMFHYNASYWKPTQIQALLKAVPDDHMIMLDLYSESHPVWNRTHAYYGKPWIWNMLHNFGGNISLWGRMRNVAVDPSAALHDPAAGKMVGIGLTPEGIEQNPALYQLMLENVWQDGPVDLQAWLKDYALQRYGISDSAIDRAWQLLEGSVYNGGLTEGGMESIIQARPTLEPAVERVNTKLSYDPAVLQKAWAIFAGEASRLKGSDGYRYDLVDITRQVLANYASVLQRRFAKAWNEKDTAAFGRNSRQFLELMDDMDRLLATRRDFLLGKWISEARACGVTPAESDLYEKNARDLVTLWGDKESGLREYSCRQWSGLIKGFYKPRWEMFFGRMRTALASGTDMDWKGFERDVKDWEWQWVLRHDKYNDKPTGDPVAMAVSIYDKYHAAMQEPVATNDHIFPADAAARPYIDFDSKGFLVNGKRTFLASAGLEYARIPHELWEDRLLKLKRAGFNCVEVYTFWNWHEPKEGVFDFSGDHDLGAFLGLVKKMGLYAIVRVGPYYCAEWDAGGYPLWLRFKEGVRVREDEPVFKQCVDRFFDRLLPIVFDQQIHRGGAVILVQLENEHIKGWGTYMPDGYFRHLQEKALSMGLKVPYFFSGLHHGSDPAGEQSAVFTNAGGDMACLDDPARPNPWMSTEFWSVWYNGYGSAQKEADEYARRTWKIIAHGGNAYNYYMAHGGSNFEFTNNDEDAASYDYGAAVGQTGDLRQMYYSFKKAAWFARSMQEVLENSEDGTYAWRGVCRGDNLQVTARHSVAGDILFADNSSSSEQSLRVMSLPAQGPLFVKPGEIVPILHNVVIAPGVKVEWAPVRVLGVSREEGLTTLVIYGQAGSPAELYLSVKGKQVVLQKKFSEGGATDVYMFDGLRVLAVNDALADRVWFTEKGIVVGPAFVGDVSSDVLTTEKALSDGTDYPVQIYGRSGVQTLLKEELPMRKYPATLTLKDWKRKLPVFEGPGIAGLQQTGADGSLTPWSWYRVSRDIMEAGKYTLQVEVGDRALIYLDGKPVRHINHEAEVPLTLTAGKHEFSFFTSHDGRDKLAGFTGDMSTVDSKGLRGPVMLVKGNSAKSRLSGWEYSKDGRSDWKGYIIGQDVFDRKQGTAWFRVALPAPPAGVTQGQLEFRSVDENATVYLNGRRLVHHEGWNIPFRVALDHLDTVARPMVLSIFIENYSNEGGIDQPVKVNYLTGLEALEGWTSRGVSVDAADIKGFTPFAPVPGDSIGRPVLYRAKFDAPVYGPGGDHLIWRVQTRGLGHGSVWVNGHNLGRYPEKTPAPGMYIPECWLQGKDNDLLIFDEDGRSADSVSVEMEQAASRRIVHYSKDLLSYVDPFIGTAKSDVYTRWGNEGGTYPGAVAPWGYVQLTPETKQKGTYDYKDSVIWYFTSLHHMSGYPSGSAGRLKVMPGAGEKGRSFSHDEEVASPGYYKVRFADDGTTVEATASQRMGMFRISFPKGSDHRVFIGRAENGVSVTFDSKETDRQVLEDGMVLKFPDDIDTLRIRVNSSIGAEGDPKAYAAEFEEVRKKTRDEWRRRLSVIEVGDAGKEEEKTIFYTALYHSILLPWVISDMAGQYKGRDGVVHRTSGAAEYGGFSAWDTFRSLHPLLCLLYPQQQKDMVISLLDIYRQTGHLPLDPMTGNHAVAVIADSWMKGIRGYDSLEAYTAMRKGVLDTPYLQNDRSVYREKGFVPSVWPESVTRTVEYAYDDWVIDWFANRTDTAGYNYRHLFNPDSLSVLPEGGERGTSGYKEGDKWVYSYFVPQHPADLVNWMGGGSEFSSRLFSAFLSRDIVFDNETVFHLPYLFNYAGNPGYTQDCIKLIRDRFSSRPGGLPGNDDLGSMSSWYVFSALGFYPVCPGRPQYDIGKPLFEKAILHLDEGKELLLRAPGVADRKYVRGLIVNGKPYKGWILPHELLIGGGEIEFVIGSIRPDEEQRDVDIYFKEVTIQKGKVKPNEPFFVRYTLENKGSPATKVVRVWNHDRQIATRNCLVMPGQTVTDSVECRLFAYGRDSIRIGGEGQRFAIDVIRDPSLPKSGVRAEVGDIRVQPLLRKGRPVTIHFELRNIGGAMGSLRVPVKVDGKMDTIVSRSTRPGEGGSYSQTGYAPDPGMHQVRILDKTAIFKIYDDPLSSVILDLSSAGMKGDRIVRDASGFGVTAKIIGPAASGKLLVAGRDNYVEVDHAPSVDDLGETLTMMVRIYPVAPGEGLMDVFSKGDNHVLQISGNRELTFFAGGWGRGDCTVALPANWYGHWHTIVGVCLGETLKVYIDGELKGSAGVDGRPNLTVNSKWVLGRNEEFPGQRAFNGLIDKAKVFAEPLTDKQVIQLSRE